MYFYHGLLAARKSSHARFYHLGDIEMSEDRIVGGAGILPVDYTYLLSPDQSVADAVRKIRALERPILVH